MALKKMKVFYYWPVIENKEGVRKILCLDGVLQSLENKPINERVAEFNNEMVQLKKIELNEKKWYLSFMKLKDTIPFKTTLDDIGDPIELDEDEFIGEEVCAIYDIESKIVAMQNNRYSISFNNFSTFLLKFMDNTKFCKFYLEPLTYPEKYTDISEDVEINYKSININYIDITELLKIEENDKLSSIGQLARDLNALTGKIELSVGREINRFLIKKVLKQIVNVMKENKKNIKSLKVKMVDKDEIRLIDLVNYKLEDEISINISKDDPKTFDKILKQMDDAFNVMLKETLKDIPTKYIDA